jgi:hypothetical protein
MTRAAVGKRDNCFKLIAALLVLIVVGPVLTVSLGSLGILVAELTVSATVVIALWSLQSSRAALSVPISAIARAFQARDRYDERKGSEFRVSG